MQNESFLKAVGMGDTLAVEGLINRGADVNPSDRVSLCHHVIKLILFGNINYNCISSLAHNQLHPGYNYEWKNA